MNASHGFHVRAPLRVCCYEDRSVAMDGLILMGESLCRVDPNVTLHLTVPGASAAVRAWVSRRPDIATLSTTRPEGVTGWDVKPWLLLQELNSGQSEALWLDADIVITKPVSALIDTFPPDHLIVVEEWGRFDAVDVSRHWGMSSMRLVRPVNSCVVRATQAHRALLQRWLELTRDARYRDAQAQPFERRPLHLISDQWILTALLESAEFGHVPFDYIRVGRDIVQCAGSSEYRVRHRVRDVFRGLPPLIHAIGRKPWESNHAAGRVSRYLLNLATDVSPYTLAARRVAHDLDMAPQWIDTRTSLGRVLRGLTGSHPGMAGLPLALLHGLHGTIRRTVDFRGAKSRASRVPRGFESGRE